MIIILTLVFLSSLILFLASFVVALRSSDTISKTCQYLISETLSNDARFMQASFGRAARRPTRVLGTFIL